jgi:hypothetical protein
MSDVREVRGAEEGVDAVGEGTSEAGDLQDRVCQSMSSKSVVRQYVP